MRHEIPPPLISPVAIGRIMQNGLAGFRGDHVPVVKLVEKSSGSYWLITAMNPADPATLWGLAHFAGQRAEIGPISFEQLSDLAATPGFSLTSDDTFDPEGKPLSTFR